MKIICADNEQSALEILVRSVREASPEAEIHAYSHVSDIQKSLKEELFCADVAFLDIEMPGMTGLELAAFLKDRIHEINIVFVTGYSEYAAEAMLLRPSGYVMKPVTKEKIREELNNLRHPPARITEEKNIRIQCFGNFEIFINNRPLAFSRSKSKELLAYLVDRRGAGVERIEMASVLWENEEYDRSHQKQLNVIRADLIRSLTEAGAEEILVQARNSLAVNPEAFDCDFYMALQGDLTMLNQFRGEYMRQYPWARFVMTEFIETIKRL